MLCFCFVFPFQALRLRVVDLLFAVPAHVVVIPVQWPLVQYAQPDITPLVLGLQFVQHAYQVTLQGPAARSNTMIIFYVTKTGNFQKKTAVPWGNSTVYILV